MVHWPYTLGFGMVWEVGRNTTTPEVGEIIRLVLIQERVAAVNLEPTTFWTG